ASGTTGGGGDSLPQRRFVVATRPLEHRGAGGRQIALHPQRRPLPAGKPLLAVLMVAREADHLRERDAKHVPARGIQRVTEALVVRGAEDVGMRAANLL